MNSSLISIVTDLEKRSYAETGLCREYYDGKRNLMKDGSMGRNGIRRRSPDSYSVNLTNDFE